MDNRPPPETNREFLTGRKPRLPLEGPWIELFARMCDAASVHVTLAPESRVGRMLVLEY